MGLVLELGLRLRLGLVPRHAEAGGEAGVGLVPILDRQPNPLAPSSMVLLGDSDSCDDSSTVGGWGSGCAGHESGR